MPTIKINPEGIAEQARYIHSPNQDPRPDDTIIRLLVIHNISLPPGEYGGDGILQLFTNQLDPHAHPYFAEIHHLKVSAHFLIRRTGELLQFVPCQLRAWHAGASAWQGQEKCNDFSIGIELEGSDHEPFEDIQYQTLIDLISALKVAFPIQGIAGHSDIAPGRKTDPGLYFDWNRIRALTGDAA